MRIDRVIYKNYCQHIKRDDTLGSGVIGVLGSNGSGKSNWLKGILRAFTGKTVNAGKNEDDVSWGEKSGSVEVLFNVHGVPGRIKRDLKTSRCSMDFGEKKYKSAKEIDAAIFDILGVSSKLLQEVVFVQQGQIEQILFQRPADRAKALQSLFGTEHAETIRTVLHDELVNCVVDSRADVIAELKGQQTELETSLQTLNAARETHTKNLLKPEKASELGTLIQSSSRFEEAKQQLEFARLELVTHRGHHSDAQAILGTKSAALTGVESSVSSLRTMVSTTRTTLASYSSLKAESDRQSTMTARVAELQTAVAILPPEDPDKADFSELDQKKAEYGSRKVKLDQWRSFLTGFENTASTVSCPTCMQPVSPEYAGEIDTAAKAESPQLERMESEIGIGDANRRHIIDAFQRWKTADEVARAELTRLQGQLVTSNQAPLPSDSEIVEMRELIATYESSERMVVELQQEIAVQTERAKNMTRAMTNASITVDKLTNRLATEPNAKAVLDAQAILSVHETAKIELARVEGEMTGLESRVTQVKTMLTQREAEEAKLEGLKVFRTLCEQARTLLHRDNLPNMVAQSYMKALNANLAHYLEIFEVPYQAHMREDTSVVCNFNGIEVPAERLSGGQRVALGLTWRFAVHNLFVNNMGLLFLDEPTVFLDKDRVDSVYRLLEKMKSYSTTAGLQLVIVTHEDRLAGVCDGVVQL